MLLVPLGAALLVAAAACDKTAKVGPDAPNAPAGKTTMPSATMPSATISAAEGKQLATSSNAFAFDLYAKIKSSPGNLAVSPASITAALAMTFGGAKSETERQMKTVMHLDGSRDTVMTDWGNLSRDLTDPARPLKLRIANRLFGEKSYTFDPSYLARTKAAYGAPLEAADFKEAVEPARARINGWVEEQTEKRTGKPSGFGWPSASRAGLT